MRHIRHQAAHNLPILPWKRREITIIEPPQCSLASGQRPQTHRQILDLLDMPGLVEFLARILTVKDFARCLKVGKASTRSGISRVPVRMHEHPLALDSPAQALVRGNYSH